MEDNMFFMRNKIASGPEITKLDGRVTIDDIEITYRNLQSSGRKTVRAQGFPLTQLDMSKYDTIDAVYGFDLDEGDNMFGILPKSDKIQGRYAWNVSVEKELEPLLAEINREWRTEELMHALSKWGEDE